MDELVMLSNEKILKQYLDHRKKSDRGLAQQYQEVRENQAYYAGDTMHYEATVNDRGRKKMVVFNRIKPFVSAIAGFMIQTRRKPSYQAVLMDSQEQQMRSEYLNALSDQYRSNANADQIETKQDIDMLIGGYGAIDTDQSYEKNPDGEIVMERVHPIQVGWDPMARESNLLDARWAYREKDYDLEEAKELFGGEDEDFSTSEAQWSDTKYSSLSKSSVQYDLSDRPEGTVTVINYQWWERQAYYRAENPLAQFSQIPELQAKLFAAMQRVLDIRKEAEDPEYDIDDLFEFDPSAQYIVASKIIKKDMDALFKNFGITIDWVRRFRRCYYTALLTDKKVFKAFKSLDQQGFTIKFKTGDFDEKNKCWFGVVTQLREPAKYANKALTEILYVIAANSKGGVMYEKGAVTNAQKFEKDYATTKAAIQVADGALTNGRIQPKAQAALPTGYENILQESKDALYGSTLINPEFLGSSENKQVSALLESQRIKQVVTTLATYFDAITLYQREHARLMLTFIRAISQNSIGRLVKVLGEDGAIRFEQLMADKLADEYEVDIGEIPETASHKEELSELAINLTQSMLPFGINMLPVTVKYLPFKQSDKQAIIEMVTPKQAPVDPVAEKAAMLALEKTGSEVRLNIAKADQTSADTLLKRQELLEGPKVADQHNSALAPMEAFVKSKKLGVDNLEQNVRAMEISNRGRQAMMPAGMQ